MSNTPTCTCLSISRDPLCVYHGDVLRLAHALNNCEVHKDVEGIRERTACAVCFTEQGEELIAEKKAGDLHRNLNRRVAEALGKPPFGKNSSWHDLPDQVEQLVQRTRWQTIETAPKDRLIIGALIHNGRVWRVHEMKHNGLAFYTFNGGSLPNMTHWMEMPIPSE